MQQVHHALKLITIIERNERRNHSEIFFAAHFAVAAFSRHTLTRRAALTRQSISQCHQLQLEASLTSFYRFFVAIAIECITFFFFLILSSIWSFLTSEVAVLRSENTKRNVHVFRVSVTIVLQFVLRLLVINPNFTDAIKIDCSSIVNSKL